MRHAYSNCRTCLYLRRHLHCLDDPRRHPGRDRLREGRRHARRQGLRVRSQALETLDGLSPYDVVTAWEFIEHVPDLRGALLRGISETGVPTIETHWVPVEKQSQIAATFTKIAKPTLQCMFEPLTN